MGTPAKQRAADKNFSSQKIVPHVKYILSKSIQTKPV